MNFGILGRIIERKLENDNDIKILIQGKNSQTGIGKTTLAIQLARFADQNGFNASNKSFINVREYINAHKNRQKGSALILDEIQHGADKRRFMSNDNVELSDAWATLRCRNIATIATLPSTSMAESRLVELADIWILVKRRGLAQPHFINVNDYAPKRRPQRDPFPHGEHIRFPDLPDDDPDKAYLDSIKDDMHNDEEGNYVKESEMEEKVEKAEKQARLETRNAIMCDLYNSFDLTYADIGSLSSIDMTRQSVGEIIRDET